MWVRVTYFVLSMASAVSTETTAEMKSEFSVSFFAWIMQMGVS